MTDQNETSDARQHIWQFFESRRGMSPPTPADILTGLRDQGVDPTPELLATCLERVNRPHPSGYFVPEVLSSFLAALATTFEPKRILDPWAKAGIVLSSSVQATGADEGVGIIQDREVFEAVQSMSHTSSLRWIRGSVGQGITELSGPFDLIVGIPPWGYRSKSSSVPSSFRQNAEFFQLLQASDLLGSNGGIIAVLTAAAFFGKRAEALRTGLQERGLSIDGVFVFPRGALKTTSLRPHVVAITQRETSSLFVAEMAAGRQGQQIIANWKERKEGRSKSLGALVDRNEFRSYDALEQLWRAERLARDQPTEPVTLDEVARDWTRFKKKAEASISSGSNFIYICQQGLGQIHISPTELPENPSNWVRVELDSRRALAGFVAAFLQTELGRALRSSLTTGATIPYTSLERLRGLELYLPDVDVQRRVLAARSAVAEASQRLDELGRRAIEHPRAIDSIEAELERLSLETSLRDWLRELPFPVASILERYHAENRPRRRREHLFHFFEALAEFNATVLLSGFLDSEAAEIEPKTLAKHLRRSSFGNWLNIAGRLAKTARSMLSSSDENERKRCLEMFSAGSQSWLEAIISKELYEGLQIANERRNAWRGHGGVLSDREACRQLQELEGILAQVSGAISDRFRGVSLVLPHEGKLKDGVFAYSVSKLVGPSTTFQRDSVRTVEPLEDNNLYLLDHGTEAPLRLLSFIRLMAPPDSDNRACYFYNRVDGEGTRWVSYHFEEDASRHTPSSDFEDLLKRIENAREMSR